VITVHFKDVGRDKRSWSKEFRGELSEPMIAKEAKAIGRLMSSDVDAELNDTGSAGAILVGGWRVVGQFTIEKGGAKWATN
jgi:hypothetical protein